MGEIKGSHHEKIFKLDDGVRLKVEVSISIDRHREVKYRYSLHTAEKGKRTWKDVINRNDFSWRQLSMEEREAQNIKRYIEVATKERLAETALELWNSLKPKEMG